MPEELNAGRAAFARREWAATHAALSGRQLAAADLELLAVAAYLLGRDGESTGAWEAAHRSWMEAGDVDRAASCACWLALTHLLRGETAVGTGWLARAERMIADVTPTSAARGLALVIAVLAALDAGDAVTARALADEIVEIGLRCSDADVLAFGLLTSGEAAIAGGDVAAGVRLFDEVMVGLATDEVSPVTAGIVYCAVIDGCMLAFDLRRAAEWTDALRRWCAEQPDLVPFRGQCLVHRSQVHQARGEWTDAIAEADRARQLLSDPVHPALGVATYQRGELHRVRGELDDAERFYRTAATLGYDPAPGDALVRLAQGRVREAVEIVERVLDDGRSTPAAPSMLTAAVEVFVAAGEIDRARVTVGQLSGAASVLHAPLLDAASAMASGRVLLAEGDAAGALVEFGTARDRWRALGVRYETALARTAIARACREIGDHDRAEMELATAIDVLHELGARTELERALGLRRQSARRSDGLTTRECEVLRLVAGGGTNREIAASMQVSEHTVARHLQNIFVKLGLSSRAAATAYAYEQGLIRARGQD